MGPKLIPEEHPIEYLYNLTYFLTLFLILCREMNVDGYLNNLMLQPQFHDFQELLVISYECYDPHNRKYKSGQRKLQVDNDLNRYT